MKWSCQRSITGCRLRGIEEISFRPVQSIGRRNIERPAVSGRLSADTCRKKAVLCIFNVPDGKALVLIALQFFRLLPDFRFTYGFRAVFFIIRDFRVDGFETYAVAGRPFSGRKLIVQEVRASVQDDRYAFFLQAADSGQNGFYSGFCRSLFKNCPEKNRRFPLRDSPRPG